LGYRGGLGDRLRQRDIGNCSFTGEAVDEHRVVRMIGNFCLMNEEENVNDIDVEDNAVDIAKMKSDLLIKKKNNLQFF